MACVYALINPSMPGLVKIGFTHGRALVRAAELSSATGVPENFVVVIEHETDCAEILESIVHDLLVTSRLNDKREFFKIAVADAHRIIEEAAQSRVFWARGVTRIWDRGAPEWRMKFLAAINQSAFDNTRAA